MKLPVHIARQLIMLCAGEKLPASTCKGSFYKSMLDDGVVMQQQVGRSKKLVTVPSAEKLNAYISNHFGISDLSAYVRLFDADDPGSRAEAVNVAGDSKVKNVRTFKGFLVNCYEPVSCRLNDLPLKISPTEGSFTFIYDYEKFIPDPDVTIVGIENPENFRRVNQLRYLFKGVHPLFVSRYPQSKDLARWLQAIPNRYLHFGDLDFAGINIFLREVRCHIGDRASFFIPSNVERLIKAHGNRALFHRQSNAFRNDKLAAELQELVKLFHRHQKVLEQEVFIVANEAGHTTAIDD